MAESMADSAVVSNDGVVFTSESYNCCRAAIALLTIEQLSQVTLVRDKTLELFNHLRKVEDAVAHFRWFITNGIEWRKRALHYYDAWSSVMKLEVALAKYKMLVDLDMYKLKNREKELMENVNHCQEHLKFFEDYEMGKRQQLPACVKELLKNHDYETRLEGFNEIVSFWNSEPLRSSQQDVILNCAIQRLDIALQYEVTYEERMKSLQQANNQGLMIIFSKESTADPNYKGPWNAEKPGVVIREDYYDDDENQTENTCFYYETDSEYKTQNSDELTDLNKTVAYDCDAASTPDSMGATTPDSETATPEFMRVATPDTFDSMSVSPDSETIKSVNQKHEAFGNRGQDVEKVDMGWTPWKSPVRFAY